MAHNQAKMEVLDLREWARPADLVERSVLWGLRGPVLEIGCGPGRLVAALTESGTPALGIDISPFAAKLAADRGVPMMVCSIFDRVPGEGQWPTALLLDGSIGIGGDPTALLCRVKAVLAAGGLALIETLGPGVVPGRAMACVEYEPGVHETIPWAKLGLDQLEEVAAHAGFALETVRRAGRRWFSWLRSNRVS